MPARLDLKDKTFGEWKVLYYVGGSKWMCECSCGARHEVLGKTLNNGKSKSCGHATNQLQDLTGMTFGEYKVLGCVGKIGKNVMWECQCSCGKIKQVTRGYLKSNENPNCGHIRSDKLRARNSGDRTKLEGSHIGEWDIIRYIGNKQYECKCSCGKIKNVFTYNLVRGESMSCGHNNGLSKIEDISGRKFGELTVGHYKGDKIWVCKCSCGNITEVRKGNLLNGSVQSCGCKQYSRISKEEIESKIDTITKELGRAPFINEVSRVINRHDAHTREYIKRYELQDKINKTFGSRAEAEIYDTFKELKNVIVHDRTVLNGLELDIYIPNLKLALEINGDYWHSSIYKDENYHQLKTIECAKKGIQLIHIFEHEWYDMSKKRKIIDYINRTVYGVERKIYGRDTEIRQISNSEANKFCEMYHLQGKCNSSIRVGCFLGNELIGVMTAGEPRFNNDFKYELHRLCWKSDVGVIGGSQKLFGYLIENFDIKSIITYVDISKFTGNIYTKLGFKPLDEPITKPSYFWVNGLDYSVLSRYQCQKKNLVENGIGTPDQTEDEIMSSIGYLKVYNSGNLKLGYIKED